MVRALTSGLTGLLRSRWGVAVIIAGLVLLVVGAGRLFADGGPATPVRVAPTAGPSISADPRDDDSVANDDAQPSIPVKRGTPSPETVAYAFASAWVDHRGVPAKTWYGGLLPNATPRLAGKLRDTDPASVPADRVTGRPTLVPQGDSLVQADVATDAGTLRLRITAPDGRWLVDGIDWSPA